MSKHQARAVLDQLIGRPTFISPLHAGLSFDGELASGGMLADVRALVDTTPSKEIEATTERNAMLASAYGFKDVVADKPFIFSGGCALIPIHGLLINRFSWSWGFVTGYNFVRNQIVAAMADDEVTTLIFDVNSYGGTVAGCQETADLMFSASSASQVEGGKTSIAVVDANCCSAAYYLASQCDHVACTPTGMVGSVGVVIMHADISKMLEDIGVTITFITAGSHKADGNMYEPLSDEVRADFQIEIDAMYDTFVSYVARGRGMDEGDVRATEARCYSAADALDLGLIDAIQNPADAVEAYFNSGVDEDDPGQSDPELNENDDNPAEQETAVLIKPSAKTAPAPAQAAAPPPPEVTSVDATAVSAEARTAERQRIAGIQGHAEAAGREGLASHLALSTDLDVETAGGILAASPKSAPPAAAVAEPPVPAVKETNHFQQAMNNGTQPNVGAGTETGESVDDTVSPAKRILALQARHAGVAVKH